MLKFTDVAEADNEYEEAFVARGKRKPWDIYHGLGPVRRSAQLESLHQAAVVLLGCGLVRPRSIFLVY